jgi:hypothetical protein
LKSKWLLENRACCSPEKLNYVEKQYKNWLYLRRKYEGEILPPSKEIDEFWDAHILDTRAYHRHTNRIFGYYLHHSSVITTKPANGYQFKTGQRTTFEDKVIYSFAAKSGKRVLFSNFIVSPL